MNNLVPFVSDYESNYKSSSTSGNSSDEHPIQINEKIKESIIDMNNFFKMAKIETDLK